MALLLTGAVSFGQAIKDREVIPVAVNLNQVLRMTVHDGGNIEFNFNTIDQYKNGISAEAGNPGDGMYVTNFTVASSTRWKVQYGAEDATFIGVDDPTNNTLALDNVGFQVVSNGAHTLDAFAKGATAGAELWSAPTTGGTVVADLDVYPINLLEDNDDAAANAGDENDNDFTINWRCGTAEGDMNATALIDQTPSPTPDRYVTNVLFELSIDN